MLTRDQADFFAENGYLHLRGVIASEELAFLRAAADHLAEDAETRIEGSDYEAALRRARPDWIEHPQTHYVYAESSGGLRFHRVERMWTKDAIFRHTTMHPVVLEAVGSLQNAAFWPRGGSLVYKMPGHGAAVPWHQDIPYYWRRSLCDVPRPRVTTFAAPNFTTDFYLNDSLADRGGLWCIPGTHRQGSVDVDAMVAEHGFHLPGAVPLEAEAGDVLFHHVALLHGSDTNTSTSLRRTFYQHYMTDAVLQDAYSDWPDLKTDEQNVAFWTRALEGRRAAGLPSGGDARIGATGIKVT
jgi:phytanoyl-CoA hydroxylase